MHSHETMLERFNRLPLPAAHLVVDIRGGNDRRSIDWLRVELEDLVNEAQSFDVPRWHAVSEFLAFLRLAPDVQSGVFPEDGEERDQTSAAALVLNHQQFSAPEDPRAGARGVSPFARQRDELVQTIERLRDSRARVMQEVSRTWHLARGTDARVRVLFLVDLACPQSLSCALFWARHLTEQDRARVRPGHRPGLCVALICLGNIEEEGRPGLLIQELSRHHARTYLDTLILSDNCRHRPPGGGLAQACIGAHLVYALLMSCAPSFPVFSQDPSAPLPADEGEQQSPVWPVQTYFVHIAVLEYSARWGRRWLNTGLAQALIETLCPQAEPCEQERIQAADSGIKWFRHWLERLRESVPLACDVLAGLQRARRVSVPTWPVFVVRRQSRNAALDQLEQYVHHLADTYVATSGEPSLQDVLLRGRAEVMQALSEAGSGLRAQQNVSTLQELQREARQLPGASGFWQSVSRPLLSTPFFLEGLAGACADLQREYMLNPLNTLHQRGRDIKERRHDMLERGRRMLRELTSYCARWPGLTSFPLARRLVQWSTFVLQAALTFLALFLGVAWLHHLLLNVAPVLLQVADRSNIPWLNLIAIILWFLLIAGEFRVVRASFSRKRASDIVIPGLCLLFLALLGCCGLLTSLGIAGLARAPDDSTSMLYLAWFAPAVPPVTRTAFLALASIVLGETVYFFCWSLWLRRKWQCVIRAWQQQQQQDVRDVLDYVALGVALDMAQRADLYDRHGGPGNYFYRVRALVDMIRQVSAFVQRDEYLAAERLLLCQGDGERGVERAWIRAHVGSEELDVDELVSEYEKLRQVIAQDRLPRVLAEYLLRAESAEPSEELELDMRERLSEVESAHRPLLRLLLSMVAFTTRTMLDPLPVGRIDLGKGDYWSEQRYIEAEMPALRMLVQAFNARIRQGSAPHAVQNRSGGSDPAGIPVVGQLLALVAQSFWQQRGSEQLKRSLALKSIWEHLEHNAATQRLPDVVVHRLKACAGGSTYSGRQVDQYLLAAALSSNPSLQGELKDLMSARVSEIADQERLLLFGIRRVVTR